MANQDHLDVLGKGVKVWNDWRTENLKIIPDLSNTDLKSVNLSGANLSRANLSKAILSSAILSSANLSSANLSRANLSGADLSKADLQDTNLDQADLSFATLRDANLNRAILSGADLNGVVLSGVDLSNVDLSQVQREILLTRLDYEPLPTRLEYEPLPTRLDYGVRNVLKKDLSRSILINSLYTLLIYYFIFILLFVLFSILIAGLYQTFTDSLTFDLLNEWGTKLKQNNLSKSIIYGIFTIPLMWICLKLVVNEVLIYSNSSNRFFRQILSWLIRLWSSIPTLVLGAILMIMIEQIGVKLPDFSFPFLLILFLVIIALPTALQIGLSTMKDFQQQYSDYKEQGLALGATDMEISRFIIIPAISNTINMGNTIAMGRVFIEGFITLNNSNIFSEPQNIRSIFYALYSQTMIENNIILIIALLAFSLVTMISLYGIIGYIQIGRV